jgi:periplasmic mercuric ion binding protein
MKESVMRRLLLSILLFSAAAQATELTAHVQGMVCSFCAQGLGKKFKAENAVETFKVDLDAKQVRLKLKEGQAMSDDYLKELIVDSGFNVEKIERK